MEDILKQRSARLGDLLCFLKCWHQCSQWWSLWSYVPPFDSICCIACRDERIAGRRRRLQAHIEAKHNQSKAGLQATPYSGETLHLRIVAVQRSVVASQETRKKGKRKTNGLTQWT